MGSPEAKSAVTNPIIDVAKGASGTVYIVKKDGTTIPFGETPTKTGKKEKLSRKSREAVLVLTLLTRETFFSGEGDVDQDGYYNSLEAKVNWNDYHPDDIKESFRLAAARLGNEGIGADEAARLVAFTNWKVRSGFFTKEEKELEITKLANDIRGYYPANFPKNKIGPWSK